MVVEGDKDTDLTTGKTSQRSWEFQFRCNSLEDLKPTFRTIDKNAISGLSNTTPLMCKIRDLNYEVEIRADLIYR